MVRKVTKLLFLAVLKRRFAGERRKNEKYTVFNHRILIRDVKESGFIPKPGINPV